MAINDVRRVGSELHHYLTPIGPDGVGCTGKVCLDRRWDEGRHLFPAAARRVIDAGWKIRRDQKSQRRRQKTQNSRSLMVIWARASADY